MLSPMKNQVSSGRPVGVAEMSWMSIWPSCTPLLLSLGGAAVMVIRTQVMPVKSNECARVRTMLPVTVTTLFQSPSVPVVELAEVSIWLNVMHRGLEAPWFGLHLVRGNSLIGAEGSFKYFLLGAFSSAFFLYGIAFTYGLTGSTNLDRIGTLMAAGGWSRRTRHLVVMEEGVVSGGVGSAVLELLAANGIFDEFREVTLSRSLCAEKGAQRKISLFRNFDVPADSFFHRSPCT